MRKRRIHGFSLVELLIVAAVSTLFFGGLFVAIQSSLRLIVDSRARTSALSLAGDQIEYIRSLAYDAVGTVSGIPSGLIPQVSTTTLNGILFTKRTLIEYVDDPADGLGASDGNGITTDYKQVKVEISWTLNDVPQSAFLVTNIVPRSIETDVGGGTIRVNVFDAALSPVVGASVRLTNNTGTTSIDVTRTTDASGIALFGGAPAAGGYQVQVTKAGYSLDQTRVATGTLANPASQPFAVVEADISTVNFFIDRLSTVNLRLLTDYTTGSTSSSFASTSELLLSTSTAVTGGALTLSNTLGVYDTVGSAVLLPITPSPLARWDTVQVAALSPTGTTWRLQFYSDSNATVLIPDSVLPGNSTGFTGSVDISTIPVNTYGTLHLGFVLTTSNTALTPSIDSIKVIYRSTETALANTAITMQGSKTIGTDNSLAPVYKTEFGTTTDAEGERLIANLEWDAYSFSAGSYDIAENCFSYPMQVPPGQTISREYVLRADSAHSLQVTVIDGLGQPVRDAVIRLERGGNQELSTGKCGQGFFESLIEAVDYRVEVSAAGYSPVTIDPVSVTGDTRLTITL